MELRLENFVNSMEIVTNIHRQNEAHILVRIAKDKSYVFCVGYHCPRYVLLPNEAIWLDMNPESTTYRSAYKRISRDRANPYNDVWTLLYFYDDAFTDQTYAAEDLTKVSIELPTPATTTVSGIGLLSSVEPEAKIVVNGDPRLSDDRYPTDHTHPETPATIIKSPTVVTLIADQTAPRSGYALVYRNGVYVWDRVLESDLEAG